MKLHRNILAVILTILICVGISADEVVIAQPQKPKMRNWAAVRGWTTATWSGDDKPYQQMRATIDNAVNGGRKPQELIEFYEIPALEHPNDPKLQFKWAYAAYIAAKQTDYNQGEKILGNPREALVLAPFPHSYEYARLIFLAIGYMNMPVGSQLQGVSKRMVLHFPNDGDVKYAAASNLIHSSSSVDRQLGLSYIKELIRTEPQRASPNALLGSLYYEHWQVSKSRDDASDAIASYRRYLELTPMKDTFRQRAQEIIAEIQKG